MATQITKVWFYETDEDDGSKCIVDAWEIRGHDITDKMATKLARRGWVHLAHCDIEITRETADYD